jgi:hypothetical protein
MITTTRYRNIKIYKLGRAIYAGDKPAVVYQQKEHRRLMTLAARCTRDGGTVWAQSRHEPNGEVLMDMTLTWGPSDD